MIAPGVKILLTHPADAMCIADGRVRDWASTASSQSRTGDIQLGSTTATMLDVPKSLPKRQFALPAAGIAHLVNAGSLFTALQQIADVCLALPEGHAFREDQRGKYMKSHVKTLLVGAALMAMGGVALAHHSFAMFDQEHPIDLIGVVKEWKYTAPHAFIILEVKEQDGSSQVWSLEGGAPSGLIRQGWTSKTLKPGDEVKLTVDPLRSGAPGGSWNVNKIKYKSGDPIVVTQ